MIDAELRAFAQEFEPPLDPKIAPLVKLLMDHDIYTVESCEGGEGHAYTKPTVRFHGTAATGWHALALAFYHGFKVTDLRLAWPIHDDMAPNGPYWEILIDTAT